MLVLCEIKVCIKMRDRAGSYRAMSPKTGPIQVPNFPDKGRRL